MVMIMAKSESPVAVVQREKTRKTADWTKVGGEGKFKAAGRLRFRECERKIRRRRTRSRMWFPRCKVNFSSDCKETDMKQAREFGKVGEGRVR